MDAAIVMGSSGQWEELMPIYEKENMIVAPVTRTGLPRLVNTLKEDVPATHRYMTNGNN